MVHPTLELIKLTRRYPGMISIHDLLRQISKNARKFKRRAREDHRIQSVQGKSMGLVRIIERHDIYTPLTNEEAADSLRGMIVPANYLPCWGPRA
jgi:hypothetical protein